MNIQVQNNFIELYDSHFTKVFRFCYFRTYDRELAKDLAQQAFLKTWGSLQEKEDIENIRAFVYAVANNLVIDWYKKKKSSSLDDMMEAGYDPADQSQNPENDSSYQNLLDVLEELNEPDKTLVTLRHVNGLKPREIAEILKKDVNSVTVAIHRATKKLKDILKSKNI